MAGMNEPKRDGGFSKPNSPPSSVGRVASHNNGDYSIQICSIPSSNPPHQHTSSFAASSNKDPSFLKETLYRAALEDKWEDAKDIFDKYPDMVRTPLTGNGDTTLHVAVCSDSLAFAEELVNLAHMTSQDLEIPNSEGNTASCIAAILGYSDLLAIMLLKNENLPLIHGQHEMLPVHLAASSGHEEIADLLSSDDLLEKMVRKDIERLFLLTIRSDMYDVANKICDKYIDRDWLVTARDDQHLTALHIMAQKWAAYHPGLFRRLWDAVSRLDYSIMLELTTKPSLVLFDAIESGWEIEAINILSKNPRLLTLQDSHGRNVLHCAAQHGRVMLLLHVLADPRRVKHMIGAVDLDGNNVLHSAAKYQSPLMLSTFSNKLLREEVWFKLVARKVPNYRDLPGMKNKEGKTPIDMFYANRIELSKDDRETAKGIANSGMVVAALIATVAFAAALTVPGDKTSAWFAVFILTNTIALFASCASIISFLSIFTSPLLNSPLFFELVISLTPINIGLGLVIVSVVAMIVSFVAASFLIFGHLFKWAAYVVLLLAVLPILMLLILRSDYLRGLRSRFFNSH